MIGDLLNEMFYCTKCSFANRDYPPVLPARNGDECKVMFVGENPSWQFGQRLLFDYITNSGRAIYDNYIIPLESTLKLKEKDIWVTDIFKCRYPKEVYREKSKKQNLINSNVSICVLNCKKKLNY